jgi:ABC-type proline/glycine betaine transport system ATPase subunit
MKRLVASILLLSMCAPIVQAGNPDEISAIKKTAMDYMESWYEGNVDRMKDSLHKKLAKRSLKGPFGEATLSQTTASDMLIFTKQGYGKSLWQKEQKIEVIVLDHYKNIASVKVVAPHYYEYLHLAKIEDKWVILNALYENKLPTID